MNAKKNKCKIYIDPVRCKGCMICVDVCPNHALERTDKVNKRGMQYVILAKLDGCTGCGICAIMCPDSAIEIGERETKSQGSEGRRT